MVTQRQIADKLGISQSAVACAFNTTNPTLQRLVSDERRQLIMETAAAMGYVPNRSARRLAKRRFGHTDRQVEHAGFIYLSHLPGMVDNVCMSILQGAEQELSAMNALIVYIHVRQDADWERIQEISRSRMVDGWLVVGPVDEAIRQRLAGCGLPFVVLGDHRCTEPVHCVSVDNAAIGRMAVQHLTELGHRHLAYITTSTGALVYQRQIHEGFRQAVAANRDLGLKMTDTKGAIWTKPEVDAIMGWLWALEPRLTAVFAPEFGWADIVCSKLAKTAFNVPRDISVVGMESSAPCDRVRLETRIVVPVTDMGRQGALLLQRLVTDATDIAPAEILIPPTFEAGATSGPAPGAG